MFNWLKQLLFGKDQNEMEYAELLKSERKAWLDRNDSFKDKVQVWLDNEIVDANKKLLKDAELELDPGFAPPPTEPIEAKVGDILVPGVTYTITMKRKPGRPRKVKV